MSRHIPFEIQVEIMQKLPIKPLIRFTSVSKLWKSFIYSSEFIAHYKHQHHLLAIYKDLEDNEVKYVSILDDDTFPKHKFFHTVPMSIDPQYKPRIVGCSKGLLCLYRSDTNTAILWNPAIRKSVAINMPNVLKSFPDYTTFIAFGVCPNTCDPKLVQITFNLGLSETINWQVKLFTLSTRAWRSVDMPGMSVVLYHSHLNINRFIYWKALHIDNDCRDKSCRVIMSYDMKSEEFTEINLPDSLAFDHDSSYMSISKLRESLVVLEYIYSSTYYDVWVMENGTPSSFKKIFTIKVPEAPIPGFGFRKNGEVIYLMTKSAREALFVYEPYSEHKLDIEVYGKNISYVSSCYMETLLLLDQ